MARTKFVRVELGIDIDVMAWADRYRFKTWADAAMDIRELVHKIVSNEFGPDAEFPAAVELRPSWIANGTKAEVTRSRRAHAAS